MKKIALEEHFLPEGDTQVSRLLSPEFTQYVIPRLTDMVQERLAEMDTYEIEKHVLSLTAPGIEVESDAATAVTKAKQVNDALAETVQRHPDRFAAFAALPLQNPQAAADELERAVTQLRMKGALLNGRPQNIFLDDPACWPVWKKAEELGVPVYLHPGYSWPNSSQSRYEGYPELLGPTWDWGVEIGTYALRLIFSGVFDAFPGLTVILGHMGEMLPYLLWRLDSRVRIASTPLKIKKLPSEYMRENFVITTSGQFAHAPLLCAIQALGADRVLFSIDYPYEQTAQAAQFIESAPISQEEKELVCYRNAERVLHL
jgi:2,3-dihydroxybenzoate decarboxylase